jgi:serine/threonine protein kinase
VVGRGGFGKVWKVEKKNTKEFYALKDMSKGKIIAKKSERSVMNERKILGLLKHK